MKDLTYLNDKRIRSALIDNEGLDERCNGFFIMRINGTYTKILATTEVHEDGIWEHVSVSHLNKTPSWDIMCKVKDMFFEDEEVVIQYHPKKSEYVNLHKHCLHMWRPVDREITVPTNVK